MAKYFTLMHGLRGCYMPDGEPCVIKAATRRELEEAIFSECDMIDSGATIGLSKRNIAALAAACWREAHKERPAYLPHCLPCREKGESIHSYGVFVSVASRAEYLEANKESDQ
jgi:hypothetical protein